MKKQPHENEAIGENIVILYNINRKLVAKKIASSVTSSRQQIQLQFLQEIFWLYRAMSIYLSVTDLYSFSRESSHYLFHIRESLYARRVMF